MEYEKLLEQALSFIRSRMESEKWKQRDEMVLRLWGDKVVISWERGRKNRKTIDRIVIKCKDGIEAAQLFGDIISTIAGEPIIKSVGVAKK